MSENIGILEGVSTTNHKKPWENKSLKLPRFEALLMGNDLGDIQAEITTAGEAIEKARLTRGPEFDKLTQKLNELELKKSGLLKELWRKRDFENLSQNFDANEILLALDELEEAILSANIFSVDASKNQEERKVFRGRDLLRFIDDALEKLENKEEATQIKKQLEDFVLGIKIYGRGGEAGIRDLLKDDFFINWLVNKEAREENEEQFNELLMLLPQSRRLIAREFLKEKKIKDAEMILYEYIPRKNWDSYQRDLTSLAETKRSQYKKTIGQLI